jgi:hypothetical protein
MKGEMVPTWSKTGKSKTRSVGIKHVGGYIDVLLIQFCQLTLGTSTRAGHVQQMTHPPLSWATPVSVKRLFEESNHKGRDVAMHVSRITGIFSPMLI